MIVSIVGLILTFNLYDDYPSFAFAFTLVFVLMFVASLISMTYAPVGDYELKDSGEEE